MVTTTSLKVGESLTIGLYFNNNYQLPSTCNLITYIGGVCVGNLQTQQPPIEKVISYYTIRLSSQDTSKMRGYRDLIVVLDDPSGFGNKKNIVGGILFDKLADEFISTSENQGYNLLIGMTIDQSVITGNVELISAIKGDKGNPGESFIQLQSDFNQTDNTLKDFIKNKPVIPSITGLATTQSVTDEATRAVTAEGVLQGNINTIYAAGSWEC